jgi:RecA-family ATPase
MTAHRNLVGTLPPRPLRVALINFEDTRNTMDKRIVAAMKHYQLKPEDIGDRLFVFA